MTILVDTSILVRQYHPASPQCQLAIDAPARLRAQKDTLCLVPQNIYELWAVATRPLSVNGLGLASATVTKEVAGWKTVFDFLDETPAVFIEWEKLIARHNVMGKNVHDAHLVAAMLVHGITHLLTFNQQDFQRYTNITVLTPADVMAMP